MRRVKLFVETGIAGACHEEIIEVDDDCTEEELQNEAETFLWNHVNYGYIELD